MGSIFSYCCHYDAGLQEREEQEQDEVDGFSVKFVTNKALTGSLQHFTCCCVLSSYGIYTS